MQSILTIIGIIYIAAFAFAVNLLIMSINKRLYKFLWALVLLALISFFGLQNILRICIMASTPFVEKFSLKTIFIMAILLLIIIVFEVVFAIVFHRWDKNHITRQSIAEALNKLDSGICCYYPSGQILLINDYMKKNMRLCLDEKNICNGEWLFDAIYKGDLKPGCQRLSLQDKTAIMLPSKKVLLMDFYIKIIKAEEIRILFATDLTEEYNKTAKLYDEQETLKNVIKKLLDYNLEIVDMVSSKEKLNAKVKIHGSLGEELLMIKRYIECGGGENERKGIKDALNQSLTFLMEENSSEEFDEYALMIDTAKELGVEVFVEGSLPEKEPFKHIIASGIHVCFTNTIRHAKGDKLFVGVRKKEEGLEVTFSNNGDVPRKPIVEKSGLLSLRELVEKAGGTMVIEYTPEYKLKVLIPTEDFR